ncbi:MAG: flagellar motor switch protein FliN [Methylococcaceae bacterium TMED69]|nr:MAG: flagellar motor switch protein FliN [Methylococcaceae bacterium TMED69]|tara:strand:+ start:648 stop:1031 length:384 start_codon:yes stop_codon:yes gene_type:complete
MAETETENEESNQVDNEPSPEVEKDSSEENQNSDNVMSSHSGQINSDVLQNIPVTISVEVGRTTLKIRDLMRLTQGSVVELDRIAGEPLDLLVNDTLVAQGEIVLVNERYGVRLTSVIPAADRVKNL